MVPHPQYVVETFDLPSATFQINSFKRLANQAKVEIHALVPSC
jgi:hypothetical protein